jgi:hypothetical protein
MGWFPNPTASVAIHFGPARNPRMERWAFRGSARLSPTPRARILPGPMLRLLGALQPTIRSDLGSQRDRVLEPPVLRGSGLRFSAKAQGMACLDMPVMA